MTVHRVSPSQIKLYRECERKYGFKYIDRIKEPVNPKQQFGIDGHAHLEKFLKGGPAPDNSPEGMTAKQGIRKGWLPTPGPHLLVEHRFELPMPEIGPNVVLIGYIDCVEPPDLVKRAPLVVDHKFTSSLQWAMTEDELQIDPQGIIYAKWAMKNFKTDVALARWIYYVASNPKEGVRKPAGARPVDHLFNVISETFQTEWARIVKDVRAIVQIRTNRPKTISLPATATSCGNYGGCFFNGNPCELSGPEILKGHFAQFNLKNRSRKSELTQCSDSSKMGDAAKPKKEPKAMSTLMEKLKGMKKGTAAAAEKKEAAPDPLEEQAKASAKPSGQSSLLDKLQKKGDAVRVNPDESETPKAEAKPAPAAKKKKSKKTTKKATTKKDEGSVEVAEPKPNTTTGEKPNGKDAGLVVLFGCAFEKNLTLANGVYHLIDLLQEPMDAIVKEKEVAHWGLLDYGQSFPMLSAAFDEWMQEKGPKEGVIIADASTRECRAVKEVLRRRADVVITRVST